MTTLVIIIQDGGGSRCTMRNRSQSVLGAMKELQGNIEETFTSLMVKTFAFSTVHVMFAESSSKSYSSLAVNLSLHFNQCSWNIHL